MGRSATGFFAADAAQRADSNGINIVVSDFSTLRAFLDGGDDVIGSVSTGRGNVQQYRKFRIVDASGDTYPSFETTADSSFSISIFFFPVPTP
jgi:hypothetical protein